MDEINGVNGWGSNWIEKVGRARISVSEKSCISVLYRRRTFGESQKEGEWRRSRKIENQRGFGEGMVD
jgi:hypothetical protein